MTHDSFCLLISDVIIFLSLMQPWRNIFFYFNFKGSQQRISTGNCEENEGSDNSASIQHNQPHVKEEIVAILYYNSTMLMTEILNTNDYGASLEVQLHLQARKSFINVKMYLCMSSDCGRKDVWTQRKSILLVWFIYFIHRKNITSRNNTTPE